MKTTTIGLATWLGLAALAACGGKVEIDEASFCLAWKDGGVVDPPAAPPEGLACAVAARNAKSVEPPFKPSGNWNSWELRYLCIEAGGSACPSAADARSLLDACVHHREGEGCGHPLSGACAMTALWSACGPDPDATGGCCYFAYVATTVVLSEDDRATTTSDARLASDDRATRDAATN